MSEGRLQVHHGDVLQFDWRSCDNHVQVKQWEEGRRMEEEMDMDGLMDDK